MQTSNNGIVRGVVQNMLCDGMAWSPPGCNLLIIYNQYNFDASVILSDNDTILPNFVFALKSECSVSESVLPVANLLK